MTAEHVVWLAVDEDGNEVIWDSKPFRYQPTISNYHEWSSETGEWIILPSGTIEKIIGRKLTFADEPVEYRG